MKQADGSYKITGTKIFISAGEHDLAENIIHLVLARIEGAPEGIKGISLFIVPKFLVNADGSLGARNGVICGSIEHKMGIHGNSTCVMNYDGATGWLVGEENKGLNAMFTMMNEARLGVGMQGLAQSEVAYQNAANYARERLQGRSISGREGARQAGRSDHRASGRAPHADVDQVVQRGGARAGAVDRAQGRRRAPLRRREGAPGGRRPHGPADAGASRACSPTTGFDNTVMAQQVFGGHGYIAEHGMEQFVRDARIAMIYEGANGIQALDLVGRKLGRDGGRAITAFFERGLRLREGALRRRGDEALCRAARRGARRSCSRPPCGSCRTRLKKPDNAGAGSTDYMHLFGLVALAYMWAQMAKAAQEKLKNGANGSEERMKAKLVTGKFFMERVLPETRRAPEAHPDRRRHHDGAARGGVLASPLRWRDLSPSPASGERHTERVAMSGNSNNLTGGCQCGAVRYEWTTRPAYSSVCYCRMCQKASGQPFMGLTGGKHRAPEVDARRAVDLPLARTWRSAASARIAARRSPMRSTAPAASA